MNDWPFADAPDTLVFTTQPVLDGDWQVLCGTTLAVEDARLVHFGHLVELTPSLASLADLPRGWSAARCTDAGPDEWHRHPRTLRAAISGWLRRT